MNDQRNRVAVIADGVGSTPSVTTTIMQLRQRGVPGYDVDVLGAGVAVDQPPAALADRRYNLVHLVTPGPAGIAALQIGQTIGLPVLASYGGHGLDEAPAAELRAFYRRCRVVLSPSRLADRSLSTLGVPADRIERWACGVDLQHFNPARAAPGALPRGVNILYSGRLSRANGVELLAESFLIARDRDPRLRLVLAGGGPEERWLRDRLRDAATFLGWLDSGRLASVYASADLLVFPSTTDTFGHVILEAQASGLPVLAVDAGGSAELIESGRSGCLVAAEPEALASAIYGLARRETLRDRLAIGGLAAVRERSSELALAQLARHYGRALTASATSAQIAHAA